MKKTNLKGIQRVRFCDYTEYQSEKSNNGGCYGFWTDYNRLENGEWEVSYGTTADFAYCPVCAILTIIMKEMLIAAMIPVTVVESSIL